MSTSSAPSRKDGCLLTNRKRTDRPWESSRSKLNALSRYDGGSSSSSGSREKDAAGNDLDTTNMIYTAPFIQVDGKRYFADRFYLLTPNGDDDTATTTTTATSTFCTCGSQQPPPTLNRDRLIQSLDLQAAILGTYTVTPSYVMELLENIPTLVLHGHKGLDTRLASFCASGTNTENSNGSINDIGRNNNRRIAKSSALASCNLNAVPDSVVSSGNMKNDWDPPEEAWFELQSRKEQSDKYFGPLPPTLHFTRIYTKWLPPTVAAGMLRHRSTQCKSGVTIIGEAKKDGHDNDDIIVIDDSDDESDSMPQGNPTFSFQGVDPAVAKKRLSKRGVHHPKFMLLFEKSGSVVVLVATSNLTQQESLDGVWVQRFAPSTAITSTQNGYDPTNKSPVLNTKIKVRRHDGSDFGHVLADFLQKQSDAAQVGAMLPIEFLRHYLDIRTLDDFRDAYCFQESQVHLIATIPGDHYGKVGVTHLGRKDGIATFLYGAQRVSDIMDRLTNPKDQNTKPWFPMASSRLMSNDDRLLFQPTSLGGHWTASEIASLVRTYLGMDRKDSDMLERTDIIWPTYDFIKTLSRKERPSLFAATEMLSTPTGESEESKNGSGGFIFLASQVFNTIDLNVISRMTQYIHSNPPQVSSLRAPHFKSYARVFEGNEFVLRREQGVGKAAEMFSWFLMSSACLSRGAQGVPTEGRSEVSDQVSYSNFELGILFVSRLQRSKVTDRVYCWKPNHCACGSSGVYRKLIHLPIPYAVRSHPYQVDPEEAHMCKTPYFHEITPESACVGLMALTPYGKILAAKHRLLDAAPSPSFATSSEKNN